MIIPQLSQDFISEGSEGVTLTSFVAGLPYSGLANFYIMCEIDAREGAESLALIFAFVSPTSQDT